MESAGSEVLEFLEPAWHFVCYVSWIEYSIISLYDAREANTLVVDNLNQDVSRIKIAMSEIVVLIGTNTVHRDQLAKGFIRLPIPIRLLCPQSETLLDVIHRIYAVCCKVMPI
jgi:hypothetical protein